MDITQKTETELKALIYDQLVLRDQTNQNITVLQQELAKRVKPEVKK